jgi:site-specific DNA recombinase
MSTSLIHNGSALIYCRVSTRGQEEEGTSLDSQEAACRQKAEELGYTIATVTREVFTGAELWDRPLLSRDRLHIKEGKCDALIAYATDRLARNPVHLAIIAEECERAGVVLVFVTEPLDASPEGALIRYVKGYAANVEREKIRERSIRGKQQRLLSGKLLRSGTDLYGYQRVEEGARREINELEAGIVRQIYQWFADENVSLRQIVRRLNERGVSTPTAGKRTPYQRRTLSGQRWNHTTTRNILSEPAYKGETILSRWKSENGRRVRRPEEEWVHLPDGTTPPIVSADQWDRAQQRLSSNGDAEKNTKIGRSIARRNEVRPALLRGLIVCAVCNLPMRYHVRSDGRRFYECSSREHSGEPCGARRVPAIATIRPDTRPRDEYGRYLPLDTDMERLPRTRRGVEEWVWEQVATILRDPGIVARELDRQEAAGPDPVLAADLERARHALRRIEQQQERLLTQFSRDKDDAFPWEMVKQQISRLEREKAHHRAAIDDLERRIAERERGRLQLASLSAYCERVSNNLEIFGFQEKRLALEALQVRVVANGRDWSLSGSFPIDETGSVAIGPVLETSRWGCSRGRTDGRQ